MMLPVILGLHIVILTVFSSIHLSIGYMIPRQLKGTCSFVDLTTNKKRSRDIRKHSSRFTKRTAKEVMYSTSDRMAVAITTKRRKRDRLRNTFGLHRLARMKKKDNEANKATSEPVIIKTAKELDEFFTDPEKKFRHKNSDEIDYDKVLASFAVIGDTQIIGSKDHPDKVHPCLKLLHERRRSGSTCIDSEQLKLRPDGKKVALVVEGGGMRGCVSAGMVTAIHYLGLDETFDVVYGSSAGSVIGSYFITKQLPWFGPEIYYDSLTMAGRDFIDTRRLLRALGVGLLNPYLLKDVVFRPENGKPVLNLSYLLKTTACQNKPLNWDLFVERQRYQPLKIVASGLKCEKPVVMDYANKSFQNIEELTNCMHGSCLLPGIAGPVMNIKKRDPSRNIGIDEESNNDGNFVIANNLNDDNYEPLADALLFETIPYRTALAEGATHAVVLRTRPDGVDTTGKSSVFEKMIFKRFFTKKNALPNMYKHVRKHLHKKIYGKDIITLNEKSQDIDRDHLDLSSPHIMTIALPPGSEEVTRLETGREAIFDGVRRGFARAYDALVEDPSERGRGEIVSKEIFPDEIMHYNPMEIESLNESAFEVFLKDINNNKNGMPAGSELKKPIKYEPVAR